MTRFELSHYVNSRYILATLAFVAIWYLVVLFNTIKATDDRVKATLATQAVQIEEALWKGDIIRIHKIFWPLMDEGLSQIKLTPLIQESENIGPIEIFGTDDSLGLEKQFELISNGLRVANINYKIEVSKLALSLLKNSALLYLALVLFILSMLVYVNAKTIGALKNLELRIVALSNSALQEDAKDPNLIPELENSKDDGLSPSCVKAVRHLVSTIEEYSRIQVELRASKALLELATQVSHDIRSPLSALNMLTRNISGISQEHRKLLEQSVQRIQDIASDLLKKARSQSLKHDSARIITTDLKDIIINLVNEKKIEFSDHPNIDIRTDFNDKESFVVNIDIIEFQRAISNLINNSVEAISGSGYVMVSLRNHRNGVSVSVLDNGCGIPDEILPKLCKRGVSFGKAKHESGSGLGLFHARKFAERAGGKLLIQSKVGTGTIVTMTLPSINSGELLDSIESKTLPTEIPNSDGVYIPK